MVNNSPSFEVDYLGLTFQFRSLLIIRVPVFYISPVGLFLSPIIKLISMRLHLIIKI